jgi:pimeloyl-ACP methyl ester carboxylesterase
MPFVQLSDVDLHYEVFGSGPPFLFMAETACHGDVWKLYQVPEFSRDHQVIIYDQRGTGRSKTRSNDFSTKRMADDAAALLDHLRLSNVIVCGHSMGGRVAQLLALDHPQKVKTLILASSGASHASKGLPVKMVMELVERGYERYTREHLVEIGFTESFAKAHPDRIKAFLDNRMQMLPPLEVFLRIVVARTEHDTSGRLKDIRQPTLVMVGDDEDHGSASATTHLDSAKVLASNIPAAEFVILPDQGHHYLFGDPAQAHAAMRDFIERHR